MLGKCMNPGCLRTFHYFGQGRVYLKPSDSGHPGERPSPLWPDCAGPREYFWLCEQCSLTLTLAFGHDGRPLVRQRHGLLGSGVEAARAAD